MSGNTNNIKQQTNEAAFIRTELQKIAESAHTTALGLTYYFNDRDSNPLKNVIMGRIVNSEFTYYHKHDFYEMNFVIKGQLYQHLSGNSFVLKEGDLLLMSPGVFHTCYSTPESLCVNILFKSEWLEQKSEIFGKYDTDNYLTSIAGGDIYTVFYPSMQSLSFLDIVKKLLDMSFDINRHQDLYENLHFENAIYEFLLLLTRCTPHNYSALSGERKGRPNYSPDDMIRYLNDNFDKVTLEDAAARFGYSSSQFHRIIKKYTGKSFTSTILSMRMMRARHLLLNTNIPIKDIAVLLGLDSAEHFSRMFKKNRGMTPKEYRDAFTRQGLNSKKE